MLKNFLGSFVVLIIVIFQHDIRRALSRVGRGLFFPQIGRWEETQVLEHTFSKGFDEGFCKKDGFPLGFGVTGTAAALRGGSWPRGAPCLHSKWLTPSTDL